MIRFSVSCLGTYETCPWSCKMTYNEIGVDKNEDVEGNFYGEFGSLLHDLFDRYYKDDLAKPDMVIEFHRKVTDLKYDFPDGKKQDYLDSALEQIDYFYEKYADMKPLMTEEEIDITIEGVPLPFKGFVDRIDGNIEEKEIVLSDYKTGRSSKFTKRELEDNIQATVYSLWVREKFGFLPTRFVFIFTKERRTKEIVINEAFIERGLARIRRISKCIEDGIFVPQPKGGVYFCKNFCNYYKECPKFEKKDNGGWNL